MPKGSEEMYRRSSLSLFLCSQWFAVLTSNEMGPNVNQKTGKYLTDGDYSKDQMNIIVHRNMSLTLKATSPAYFHNRGVILCEVNK